PAEEAEPHRPAGPNPAGGLGSGDEPFGPVRPNRPEEGERPRPREHRPGKPKPRCRVVDDEEAGRRSAAQAPGARIERQIRRGEGCEYRLPAHRGGPVDGLVPELRIPPVL